MPCPDWPISTPRPTNTPYLNPDRVATHPFGELDRLAGPPVAIEADGVAALDVPRDADVSAHLGMWTGHQAGSQTRLARLPLSDADWEQGTACIRLWKVSGCILLASDQIDAHHRSAKIRIDVGPLPDCGALRLRWVKPAAIVVKALTEQPYVNWQDHDVPPTPAPAGAALYGLTLTGIDISLMFDPTTTTYTASMPRPAAETTVRPMLEDPGETYTISLGSSQVSDNTPALVWLATGANVITVDVAPADGSDGTTCTVTVSRETPSTDAVLSTLALRGMSPDEWTPHFDPGVYDYDVRVSHSTVPTGVLPAASDDTTTFTVATEPADALTESGYGTALAELAERATTTVTITETAEDGTTTQDYVVRVHCAAP